LTILDLMILSLMILGLAIWSAAIRQPLPLAWEHAFSHDCRMLGETRYQ